MKRGIPWIHSAGVDGAFILAPPYLILALVMLFPQWFGPRAELTELHWLVLVLCIDVAHVYSTIYRTYLDREAVRHYRFELVWLPLIAFVVLVIMYSVDALWFWRCMAYMAIFHFVRQQYGFMRLYARRDEVPTWKHRLDAITIYSATLMPLLFWHFSYPRSFDWFVEGDMVGADAPVLAASVMVAYGVILVLYLASEVRMALQKTFNVPKNVLLCGTALGWYLGIVHYDGDVTFTLFNVVGHGVPYMALVWAFGRKKRSALSEAGGNRSRVHAFFSMRAIPFYLLLLFVLAYVEEGFWNSLVWDEHDGIFKPFKALPVVSGHVLLSFLVPLLALPQVTHYIIDAFIWRMRKDRDRWQAVVFGQEMDR
ncbi:MAG: hypothetical protein JNM62_04065 [Flavobacteriales bacterium]|nr:hypothetical protein [Flavobacteriales bacterium]